MRLATLLTLLWLFASGAGFAAPAASDFAGWWAVKSDERNFMVLHIAVGADGGVTGQFWRPGEFALDPDRVDRIKGATLRELISDPRFERDGVTFTVSKPDNPDDKDRLRLRLTSPQGGELMFDGVPASSMDVVEAPVGSKVAEDWRSDRSYPLSRRAAASVEPNAEMARMFGADQAVRTSAKIDWSVVGKEDEARRAATARLLSAGALHTADDFYYAAFIFQHGATPDDFLLAHTLAMIAVKKGRRDAIWIASATLDRYLQNIGRPQVYGTQFSSGKSGTTQEPYDRSLISDAVRAELNVPPQAEQEAQRAKIARQNGKP
jgi:hypothetical protein